MLKRFLKYQTNTNLKGQTADLQSLENLAIMNDLIIDAIQDIKGKNIVKIDLTKIEDAPSQFFIICEGESRTQVSSIAENIKKRLREEMDERNSRIEGMSESTWVLIDYFDTVVHVFYPEMRAFYDLEGLWSDGIFTEYQEL